MLVSYEELWSRPVWGSKPRSRGCEADTLSIRESLPLLNINDIINISNNWRTFIISRDLKLKSIMLMFSRNLTIFCLERPTSNFFLHIASCIFFLIFSYLITFRNFEKRYLFRLHGSLSSYYNRYFVLTDEPNKMLTYRNTLYIRTQTHC